MVADQQIPVVRTVVTPQGYAKACLIGDRTLTKEAVGVLFAQWMVETGGRDCWNWNVSNAKHFAGDGFDYMCLTGVWEGVSPVTASNLIAAGRAVPDPSLDHAHAVGVGKVSVIFPPPQPESRFRAFPDLASGMAAHLKLLRERFPTAWAQVLAGNPRGTAYELGAHGYFTASAIVYGNGMAARFDPFMATSAYELAAEELAAICNDDTLPSGVSPSGDVALPFRIADTVGPEEDPNA